MSSSSEASSCSQVAKRSKYVCSTSGKQIKLSLKKSRDFVEEEKSKFPGSAAFVRQRTKAPQEAIYSDSDSEFETDTEADNQLEEEYTAISKDVSNGRKPLSRNASRNSNSEELFEAPVHAGDLDSDNFAKEVNALEVALSLDADKILESYDSAQLVLPGFERQHDDDMKLLADDDQISFFQDPQVQLRCDELLATEDAFLSPFELGSMEQNQLF
eukprot:CAMPEP_0184508342 /NCGR_PEP_ID=MMETSP0198_2-20121128/711_1 /TAXON_ID=1112570 /ORGANISM="Thraustochytrium sp., Strain LLF1b" /LENGTH=214 /DNA_ID=CAMNT_0026898123 /DNA_START=1161 /DNA_END=1805 /DNA_ORIENTATION=-